MTDIYEAIVIDNKQFYEDGRIYVKVKNYNLDMPDDMSKNYNKELYKDFQESGCLKAKIFSPLAGGKNYGIFYLPQVNSKGLVATMNNDPLNLIWLGSFFDVIDVVIGEDGIEKKTINAPQDNIELDGENSSLIEDGQIRTTTLSEQAIVIRTKGTSNSSAEEMDWDKVHTDNLIVIDKDRIEITRAFGGFDTDGNLDKKQKIFIGQENGKVITNIEYTDTINEVSSKFKIEDGLLKAELAKGKTDSLVRESLVLGVVEKTPLFSASIVDELNKISTSLKTNNEELVLSFIKDDKSTYYVQDEKIIKLTSPSAAVSIKEKEVAVDAETVRISATKLYLGNSNQKIVTTDSTLDSAQLPDGAMLYFRDDKRA